MQLDEMRYELDVFQDRLDELVDTDPIDKAIKTIELVQYDLDRAWALDNVDDLVEQAGDNSAILNEVISILEEVEYKLRTFEI